MTDLIQFDPKGVWCHGLVILHNAKFLNRTSLFIIVEDMNNNFIGLTSRRLYETSDEFNELLNICEKSPTIKNILNTQIFKSMKQTNEKQSNKNDIKLYIIPPMLKMFYDRNVNAHKEYLEHKEEIEDWFAGLIDSYLTEDKVKMALKALSNSDQEMTNLRRSIGTELITLITSKQLNESDFKLFLHETPEIIEFFMRTSNNPVVTTNIMAKYMTLFSMTKTPKEMEELSKQILTFLRDITLKKYFP